MTEDNTLTKHLMNLKQQVLRFAAKKEHTHEANEVINKDGSQYNNFAKKQHASTGTEFGEATASNYGHVKVDSSVSTESTNPVQNKVITNKINELINNLKTELTNQLQAKLTISQEVKSDSTHSTIPTTKAVWNALTSYEDVLNGVSLRQPETTTQPINKLIRAGYYKQNSGSEMHFTYANQQIHYNQGLITVKVTDNRVIQHVYATEEVQSGNQVYYKLNGCEYTRYGIGEVSTDTEGYVTNVDWKKWHVAHIPYRSIAPVKTTGRGIDVNSIQIFENTAGFIFHWDQNATADDRYNVYAPLYEYAEICTFGEELPIKGPYVFGNLIGRMDIKITSTGMYIRSTVQPGGRIIEVHETYFVPRNY